MSPSFEKNRCAVEERARETGVLRRNAESVNAVLPVAAADRRLEAGVAMGDEPSLEQLIVAVQLGQLRPVLRMPCGSFAKAKVRPEIRPP